MGFGLAGVFTVLILFYFMIKILMRVLTKMRKNGKLNVKILLKQSCPMLSYML